jgi:hypothetical protein
MPFDHPTTMTADEMYATTAYVLFLNGIVGDHDVVNGRSRRSRCRIETDSHRIRGRISARPQKRNTHRASSVRL